MIAMESNRVRTSRDSTQSLPDTRFVSRIP